jgi:putative acetyltransferase
MTLLVASALENLRKLGAAGCVVLGEPSYYARFGFGPQPDLVLPGVPAQYFQAVTLQGVAPSGQVVYDAAFEAAT